jgi:hypothetical protein
MTSYKNLLLLGTLVLLVTGCEKAHDTWRYLQHGRKLQVREFAVFYKSPVTTEEMTKLGQYFIRQTEEDEDSITWKVQKTGATYEVYIPVKAGLELSRQDLLNIRILGDELSRNVFRYSKTDIHLSDDEFKTTKVLNCLQCYDWIRQRQREKEKAHKSASSE